MESRILLQIRQKEIIDLQIKITINTGRQGYMTSAMLLSIVFRINNIGLKRIYAATTQQNERAIKLFEQLNFTKITDLKDDEIKYALISSVRYPLYLMDE